MTETESEQWGKNKPPPQEFSAQAHSLHVELSTLLTLTLERHNKGISSTIIKESVKKTQCLHSNQTKRVYNFRISHLVLDSLLHKTISSTLSIP